VATAFVRRLRSGVTTPQLYQLVAAALVAIGIGAGAAGLHTVGHRSSALHDVGSVSGPQSADAQDLYRSLADADATAASAFLLGEWGVQRQRYLDDLARAGAALTVATRDAGDADTAGLRRLAGQMSTYAGLVETARSYDRLGLPLGGAYLREASALMRGSMLPAAQDLFASAQRRLAAAQREATGFPWSVLVLGVAAVAALVAAHVLVARRTNRLVNVGLAAGGLVAVISLAWSIGGLGIAARQADVGRRDGTALAALLADARRAAVQAHTDEALTLIARGSGAAYEQDLVAVLDNLIGQDGAGGLLARAASLAPADADRAAVEQARGQARRWRDLHRKVRETDDGGDYTAAVRLATTTEPDTATAVFGRLDAALTGALALADDRVARQSASAGRSLDALAITLVLLTAGLVTAVVLGIRPRLREYR